MGRYTSYALLAAEFGDDNVLGWANVQNEAITAGVPTTAQQAAIDAAITRAENSLHEQLWPAYDVPFGIAHPSVVAAATRLTAVELYIGMRGARSEGRNAQISLALELTDKWVRSVVDGRQPILASGGGVVARAEKANSLPG